MCKADVECFFLLPWENEVWKVTRNGGPPGRRSIFQRLTSCPCSNCLQGTCAVYIYMLSFDNAKRIASHYIPFFLFIRSVCKLLVHQLSGHVDFVEPDQPYVESD